MSDGLRKKIIYLTLPIAVIIAVVHFSTLETVSDKNDSPANKSDNLQSLSGKGKQSKEDFAGYKELEWGRDPFIGARPIHAVKTAIPESDNFRLGGIMLGDGSPTAIINQKIVRPGDVIDGAKVIKINKNSVTLEIKGETKQLSLAGDVS